MTVADTQTIVQSGISPAHMGLIEKKVENKFKDIPSAQLRRLFSEAKRIQSKSTQQLSAQELQMFVPKVAYAVGRFGKRNRGQIEPTDCYNELYTIVIVPAVNQVLKSAGQKQLDGLSNFIHLFEAIVAYHKLYASN